MMSASCCWEAVKFHFLLGEPITPNVISGELLLYCMDSVHMMSWPVCVWCVCLSNSFVFFFKRSAAVCGIRCVSDTDGYCFGSRYVSKMIRQCVAVFSRL